MNVSIKYVQQHLVLILFVWSPFIALARAIGYGDIPKGNLPAIVAFATAIGLSALIARRYSPLGEAGLVWFSGLMVLAVLSLVATPIVVLSELTSMLIAAF
jgi:hypothetical protein